MKTIYLIGFILALFFLLIAISWRYASKRQSLPCPVWLHWLVELDNPFTKTNRAATIISHLSLQPGMSVVDIGCGPGRLTIPVAKFIGNSGEIVAIDIQPGMLQIVKKKARIERLENIRYLQSDIAEGGLPNNQFDRALLVTVLGEIPEQRKALPEIFNSLKSGGVLSITEIIFDPHFQKYKTVKKLAESCGFKEKAFFGNQIAYTLNMEK